MAAVLLDLLDEKRSKGDSDRVASGPEFRPDLYRGTARFYDEFRIRYPKH